MKQRFKYRAVGVAIVDDMVLLYQTVGNPYWSLPGGVIERGEQAQAALVREMQEEAGIEVQIGRLVWVGENFYTRGEKPIHELALYFMIHLKDIELSAKDKTFGGYEGEHPLIFRWFCLDHVDNLLLYPQFLKSALRNIPDNTEHFCCVLR